MAYDYIKKTYGTAFEPGQRVTMQDQRMMTGAMAVAKREAAKAAEAMTVAERMAAHAVDEMGEGA